VKQTLNGKNMNIESLPRNTENIASFWRVKGLSVRASNCLAKVSILNEDILTTNLTNFEEVLALRNCGRLTAEEIWTFIMNLKLDIPSKASLSYENLSDRAKRVLARLCITNDQQLIETMPLPAFTRDEILALPGVGVKTCNEIWKLLQYLRSNQATLQGEVEAKTLSPYTDETNQVRQVETPLFEASQDYLFSLYAPLLGIEISDEIWEALQNIPVHRVSFRFRTESGILRQSCRTLADVAKIPPNEWLKLRNFGQISLTELQQKITEIIHNLTPLDKNEKMEVQRVSLREVPLLGVEVSSEIWERFQEIPIRQVKWSVRTEKGIRRQGCQTLADVAKISSNEWLRLRNFGRTSLTELQRRISEIIDPKTLFDKSKEAEVQSVSIHEVPLLGIEVSSEIWEVLQNTPIHIFTWNVRTEKGINHQGCQTFADVAKIPPNEWLRLRKFGRKSLVELQDKIDEVINNPELFSVSDKILDGVPTVQIESLLDLGHFMLENLRERKQEVIKHHYGYEDNPKNLSQAAEAIGISRERVRQIKEDANAKINQGAERDFIAKCILNLFGELITAHLSGNNGFCSVGELQQVISQKLGWGKTEQWIINWFDNSFGECWICLGADDYEIIDSACYLKSEGGARIFGAGLVKRLKRYGYRPLTLDECVYLHNDAMEQRFDSKQLLSFIESHPELKMYEYGVTYIGLREWAWFNPPHRTVSSTKEQADLVEWYLRMTNEPAIAEAIADSIWSKLGNFRFTPFEVADACENNPHRFKVDENNHYGLYIWEYASKYKQDLESLLEHEPLHVEPIVGQLSPNNSDEASFIVAALNRYKDTFVEITPFEWSLKGREDTKDVDYTKLDFEELIPK